MAYENEYDLQWFDILTFRETRYVVYGTGQWVGHVMDWAGCNYHHGRIPDSPTFETPEQAKDWLREQVSEGHLSEGEVFGGHHAGEYKCSKGCNDREVETVFFRDLAPSELEQKVDELLNAQ